jgi:hypothetical protein
MHVKLTKPQALGVAKLPHILRGNYTIASEGFDTRDLKDAKALLDELS